MHHKQTQNTVMNITNFSLTKPILILTKLPKLSTIMNNEATLSEGKTFSAKVVQ